jgi:hypothetical protein
MTLDEARAIVQILDTLTRNTSIAFEHQENDGSYLAPLLKTGDHFGVAALMLHLCYLPDEEQPRWTARILIAEGDGETQAAVPLVTRRSRGRADAASALTAVCESLEILSQHLIDYFQSPQGEARSDGQCRLCGKEIE